MLQRLHRQDAPFSSCSHHVLISKRFRSPRLTCVCHNSRDVQIGETKCQRRVLPLTPSCSCRGLPESPGNPGRAQQSCSGIHRVQAVGCREFPLGSHAGSTAWCFRAIFRTRSLVGKRTLMQSPSTKPIKEDVQQKIEQFAGQVVTDLAAAMAGVMTNLGHKLGLYRAMAEGGPIESHELARRTATNERSVREWLNGQVAGGYVLFDANTHQYLLPPEHGFVLANPDSPAFLSPAFDVAASLWHDEDQILAAFRSGKGMGWHEHNCRLFTATEAFFRNGYRAHLTQSWIPSLSGVQDKLAKGGRVADLGCGHGASVILMAQAFPKSKFVGIDYHESSIAVARERAKQAGVADQIRFEVATPRVLASSKEKFDLVCFMDSLHDMGDPLEAVWASRQAMAPKGALMLVEPFAKDRPEENVGPVARMYYSASAGFCTQNALSQGGRYSLGAQAGATQLLAILKDAGFLSARVAMETPFNLILEARS